jgi:hypothetical protein
MAVPAVQWLLSGMGAGYVLAVKWTGRLDRPEPPLSGPFILALWHGRLALLHHLRHGNRSLIALISSHRDGQFISKCAWFFDIRTVAGSTNRGGVQAVRELVRLARDGHSLFVTPDGPRGPRMRVNEGIIGLARLTGLPIVPAAISASWGKLLQTWDRFLVPFPFSRVVIRWGTPLQVGRDSDTGMASAQLERELTSLQERADREMNRKPVDAL